MSEIITSLSQLSWTSLFMLFGTFVSACAASVLLPETEQNRGDPFSSLTSSEDGVRSFHWGSTGFPVKYGEKVVKPF